MKSYNKNKKHGSPRINNYQQRRNPQILYKNKEANDELTLVFGKIPNFIHNEDIESFIKEMFDNEDIEETDYSIRFNKGFAFIEFKYEEDRNKIMLNHKYEYYGQYFMQMNKKYQPSDDKTVDINGIPLITTPEQLDKILSEKYAVHGISVFKKSKEDPRFIFAQVCFDNEEDAKDCLENFKYVNGCLVSTFSPMMNRTINSSSSSSSSTSKRRRKLFSNKKSIKDESKNHEENHVEEEKSEEFHHVNDEQEEENDNHKQNNEDNETRNENEEYDLTNEQTTQIISTNETSNKEEDELLKESLKKQKIDSIYYSDTSNNQMQQNEISKEEFSNEEKTKKKSHPILRFVLLAGGRIIKELVFSYINN